MPKYTAFAALQVALWTAATTTTTLCTKKTNAFVVMPPPMTDSRRTNVYQNQYALPFTPSTTTTRRYNWLGDLWEEVIEFSTYGPAERRMLKAKRAAAAAAKEEQNIASSGTNSDITLSSFQQVKGNISNRGASIVGNNDDDIDTSSLSLQAFQSAVAAARSDGNTGLEFDGYALRDLIVSKWGVPLDVDFQRGYNSQQQSTVYCTVLPVAFGSFKCRHANELEYLMHLQAVVEILYEYNNLEEFLDFVRMTQREPKPGVESVPFRLELSPRQLQKVLGVSPASY